ncbi:MBL fold metallo-hydrolase [Syntrophothermus lipocalidus]|uniref:Beta-lactamase domain protein n=1 Tax=Syntrophothermus lipocalidus (strain DSM 12680 / TGB-C1) TaxID=643648 RepID=D7CKN2_SYNLT|nr:MBL fold metallo-hydrolase [Syntrophothermus lipocalidus]ADI01267.1 beta-lactamase domain protein [Syntrophothermus lipocalidus DSM 12680]
MIEELQKGLYRVEIPLPGNPLKSVNGYFIRGTDRNLLIDTGFNHNACQVAVQRAMEELGFSMDDTDIFVTHVHADHSGLTGFLVRPETVVYTGEYTAWLYQTRDFTTYFDNITQQSGLLEWVTDDTLDNLGYTYMSQPFNNVCVVHDGTHIKVGEYDLRCVVTSGHAPDHVCLYGEGKGLLFSGDHILGTITPNNTIWEAPWTTQRDYLGEYLESLEKVDALDVKLVFPGHGAALTDCHKRIQELMLHHRVRLKEILGILADRFMTATEVASKMTWDMEYETWEEVPITQKVFAVGEALSHLTHLVFRGVISKCLQDGVIYYGKL